MDVVILIMVKVDGSWDTEYNFNCNAIYAMQVCLSATYIAFKEQLASIFSPYKPNKDFNLSYMVDGCPPPVLIHDEDTFRFFLNLKSLQSDFQKSPLCVEFSADIVSSSTLSVPQSVISDIPCSSNQSSSHIHSSTLTTRYTEEEYITANNETNGIDTFQSHMSNTYVISRSPTPEISLYSSPSCSTHNETSSVPHLDLITHYHPTQILLHAIYKSKAALLHHLRLYAIDNVFQFKTRTSRKKCLHVVCKDSKCKWAVRAVRLRGVQMFQIRRFKSLHTCSMDFRQGKHRQATYRTIADLVAHKYLDASRKPYTPNQIREDMLLNHGISMSYKTAWRAQKIAMQKQFGSDSESYQMLPALAYALEKANPDSIISLITSDDDVFQYFFMSLLPWREAWKYCRPVLIVDGSFLKAYYKGTLLTACAQDANGHIVPLAFGICDAECKESYLWFFSKLRESLMFREDMYIVSDRHKGLISAAKRIFPHAGHGYCVEHLRRNMISKFRGSAIDLGWKFKAAYMAATVKEYEEYMSLLDSEDIRIRPWLDKIGSHKWSKCMSGPRRYDIMTSNCAESMNNVDVSAREYSVSKLIDFLRGRMQQWFTAR